MTCCCDDIETFSRLDKTLVDLFLASAKDPATATKNVWRKSRARDGVTQRESAQHSPDRVGLAVNTTGEDSIAEINVNILACLVSINHPAFNPQADVSHEKIFEIDATAPCVIGLDVTIIDPLFSSKNIGPPKRDVEFPVRVPLRARRRSDLFHFLA